MSSTEPPSRIPPRGQSHESKSAREEISSKGRVEKVREVDADETRKRKFSQFLKDETPDTDTDDRPTIFDLNSGKQAEPKGEGPLLGNSQDTDDLGDVSDAIVAGPGYTPPPAASSFDMGEETDDDEATTGALPQSDDFWEDVDFPPEQQSPPTSFQETSRSLNRNKSDPMDPDKPTGMPSSGKPKSPAEKKGIPTKDMPDSRLGKQESSPFGPPGKPMSKEPGKKKDKLPSPFEEAAKTGAPKVRGLEKEESRYLGEAAPAKPEKKTAAQKKEEEALLAQSGNAAPMKTEDREGRKGGEKGRDQGAKIDLSGLPSFSANIQAAAVGATTQATPYLSPSTISLFFQMVGTMYVMTGTPGVSRTEIVLNNPGYANSRFFGSTITIEKYATAPDSFNIRLTGNDSAVNAFRDNIPSLMAAFQNGDFTFRVNRLDVEYSSLDKPVFRRRERGEERGEKGGGDLGERRK